MGVALGAGARGGGDGAGRRKGCSHAVPPTLSTEGWIRPMSPPQLGPIGSRLGSLCSRDLARGGPGPPAPCSRGGQEPGGGGRHGPRQGFTSPSRRGVPGKLGVPSCLCPPPKSGSPETTGPFPTVLRGHGACPQRLSTTLGGSRAWGGAGAGRGMGTGQGRNGVRIGMGSGQGQENFSPGPGAHQQLVPASSRGEGGVSGGDKEDRAAGEGGSLLPGEDGTLRHPALSLGKGPRALSPTRRRVLGAAGLGRAPPLCSCGPCVSPSPAPPCPGDSRDPLPVAPRQRPQSPGFGHSRGQAWAGMCRGGPRVAAHPGGAQAVAATGPLSR